MQPTTSFSHRLTSRPRLSHRPGISRLTLASTAVALSLSSELGIAGDGDVPLGVEQSHMTYAVKDTAIFNDPANPGNLATWEPYVGVLGNSVFLIGANTFAQDSPGNQRFAFVMQPVAGGPFVTGDHFFTDDGVPYRGQINASRQDGNPQRIAGDPRPGAANIIAGAEASPHLTPGFDSDDRWNLGFDRLLNGRYGTVQTYAVDPTSLTQSPLSKAFDAANGRLTDGVAGSNQSTRFGGDLVGLDNGNFVVAVEDRSKARSGPNLTVFVIVAPDGSIVKETTVVAQADYWSNLSAYQGGFAIRAAGLIHFFDNAGEEKGQLDANLASGVSFDRGRGDATRIGGHINSAYVYLAGVASVLDNEGNKVPGVYVAAFDARTQSFVARYKVDNYPGSSDRTVVAADALGRVTVAFESTPQGFGKKQVVARVLQLDSCLAEFTPLGDPFFPFVNHGVDFTVSNPSIAMTTKQILFAVKGSVNLHNDPAAGPDSKALTGVYAVVNHPAPEEDPTTPATLTVPSSLAAAGLHHIVPDTTFFNPLGAPQNLATWEPYVGVLGTSTFLIGANTVAEGSSAEQRFGFVMQPVNGAAAKVGDHFFGDDGVPFRGGINASRQDGNPQRVAGDPRPGAVNIMAGAEASPHLREPFKSDGRWDLGFDRLPNGRYATVQTFAIDTSSLTQTMKSKAIDAANGRLTDGVAGSSQSSRFGGDILGLDNGNFVVSVEDRSKARSNPNLAAFVIIGPDGSIVKETTVVAASDYWSNLAAYKGGFAVRAAGVIYFYNNAGDLQGKVDGNTASGVAFDRGRGDGTRLAGHINSPYVYLSGGAALVTPAGNVDPGIRLAVFDSRDQSFVTQSRVDTRNGTTDRTVLAVDALNRIVVAFMDKPPGFAASQVVARVMHFDECAQALSGVTPSFFPFINHEGNGVTLGNPSVAITTKQILVAAKGKVNLANVAGGDADSLPLVNVYTVVSHPNPQEDPTPGVGSGAGIHLSPEIPLTKGKAILSWTGGVAPFTLQTKTSITAPWKNVQTGITDSSLAVDVTDGQAYFQVIGQ